MKVQTNKRICISETFLTFLEMGFVHHCWQLEKSNGSLNLGTKIYGNCTLQAP